MQRWRAFAVIDLSFLAKVRFETTTNFLFGRNDLAHESLDRVIGTLVAVMLNEILKNRYAVTTLANLSFDERTMRFATASAAGFGCAFRGLRLRGARDFAAGIGNGARFGHPIADDLAGRHVFGAHFDGCGLAGRPLE